MFKLPVFKIVLVHIAVRKPFDEVLEREQPLVVLTTRFAHDRNYRFSLEILVITSAPIAAWKS